MDRITTEHQPRRTGSFGRTSSTGSSLRHSLSLSRAAVAPEIDDEIESESVSEAGDTGRLPSRSHSLSSTHLFRLDNPEQDNLQLSRCFSSGIIPLPEENISQLPTKALVPAQDKKQVQDGQKLLPQSLEYVSCLLHLAVFGILGALTRYSLQKLFGPSTAKVTGDGTILYLDLPSNMVGSFLMGWLGVVFKGDISRFSEFLAIGLSTGYLGSLTTFSGWNQKMLDLSINGKWVYVVLGFLLGLFLAAYSIIFGVETAKGFQWLLLRRQNKSCEKGDSCFRVDSFRSHVASILVMLLILGVLWAVSAALLKEEFSSASNEAQLWLGCLVAPLGVWLRWFLARFNGRGLGKGRHLKWVPIGTLIANVSAACIMAALATLTKAVKTDTCRTVATGIQFGLLGCLSTVSTFMAEFNAMRESKHPWRAYVYAMVTIGISFGLGILIYSVPVWILGYD